MDLSMQEVRAVPKPKHPRRTPTRAKRGAFSPKVRKTIVQRDGKLCVRCGARYEEIHHIVFRSQGGLGTVDNGVCVCHTCHEYAHGSRDGREWFENYRDKYLLREEKAQ